LDLEEFLAEGRERDGEGAAWRRAVR
jgi:hypothetical protein